MSSIVTSLTGGAVGGSGSGMGFRASPAAIQQPATVNQANEQYGNVNTGLQNQLDFVKAVQAQNGLGNQSNVFNQMQGVANGTGPNPAQAMLANSTGQNVANQAALMAGQRGSNANSGLLARQAAMQGANIQQQAAGQGAALQANQSLNALNNMGGLATNQANQQANANNSYTQNANQAQQNILGAIGAQNNANVGMQSNVNNVNGALAGHVAGQQGNMMGNMMGGIGSAMNLFGGGNNSSGGMGNLGGMFGGGTDMAGGAGDAISGSGGLLGDATMIAAKGGMVPQKYADGGQIPNSVTTLNTQPQSGPQSNVGKSFMQSEDELGAYDPNKQPMPDIKGMAGQSGGNSGLDINGMSKMGQQVGKFAGENWQNIANWFGNSELGGDASGLTAAAPAMFSEAGPAMAGAGESAAPFIPAAADAAEVAVAAKGGKVPALVSPGETYLPPSKVNQVKQGANPLAVGEKIPGKPKVKGNSYQNDTVSKDLEPGGVVIPNSIMQSKDPAKAAAKFVAAVLRKHKG